MTYLIVNLKENFIWICKNPISSQYFINLKKDINVMLFKSTNNIKWKIICITLKDKISTLFNPGFSYSHANPV